MPENGQIIEFDRKKHFKYVKELGHGGTGETSLLFDETTNTYFAFKKYRPNDSNFSDEDYDRFVQEVKILFNISHRNIVRVYNYYLYPEYKTGYLQMEYINGLPIDNFIVRNTELANDVFLQTIDAFSYLEKNKILHRDVRPSNILIDHNNHVKIIDFGFGKQLSDASSSARSIILNWPVNTYPEEIEKSLSYKACTEIYFLGKLFETIIHENKIPSFRFSEIIHKMCQRQIQSRFKTFESVLSAISESEFDQFNFTQECKLTYQRFASSLSTALSAFTEEFSSETDPLAIIEQLKNVVRANSLEEYIQENNKLLSCFIKSSYRYSPTPQIETEDVKNFYKLISKMDDKDRRIVIENINSRLRRTKMIPNNLDDVPF